MQQKANHDCTCYATVY